jgi:long-chain acyl-CoA synthetase
MQRRMDYMASKPKQNCITQFQICGDSYQSALVAIVIPDEDVVKQWSADSGDASLSGLDVKTLCKTEALKACIMNEIKTYAKKNGLHGFETPRAIYLEHEPFTVENGLTTPTMKLKRPQLRDYYQRQIVFELDDNLMTLEQSR